MNKETSRTENTSLPIALVTGASRGIGKSISEKLIASGYEVYGIGRDFSDVSEKPNLHCLSYDLTDVKHLPDYLRTNVPKAIDVLVNCAGVAYYGMHENLSANAIHEMVTVNVEIPLLLTSLYMPGLRKRIGSIVNISSVTAKLSGNTYGCAYGATKAAMTHFSESLFEETRKSGVRIITIHPDLTDTELYRNADFRPADSSDTVLAADEIADTVLYALQAREGMVVRDITLRPQRFRIEHRNAEPS